MFKFYKTLIFCLSGVILVLSFFATSQNLDEGQLLIDFGYYGDFAYRAISEQKIRLELKNNEIDLSPFIEVINKLKESDYVTDLLIMEKVISYAIDSDEDLKLLCENSSSKDNCMEKAKNSLEGAFDKVVQEKENQILYPAFYSDNEIYGPSPEINNNMIKKASKILNSECLSNWDNRQLSSIISKLHPNSWPELKDKLKHKDKNFLKKLGQGVYDKLKDTTYPEQCLDSANKNHRVCKKMRRELAIKEKRVRYLTELVYGPDILKTTEAKAPCFDCVEGVLPEELSRLDQLFSVLNEYSICFDPAIGEEKQINNNFFGGNYTIRREPDGSFSIPLNLAFSADEDYDGEIPRDQVPTHYKNKVQECLKKANSKMLGPNGEKLNIVIESSFAKEAKKSGCESAKPKTIKIGSRDYRSYMGKYRSNIDCPTITHEVLHLLGLCDEYKATVTKFQLLADTGEITKGSIYEESDNENDQYVLAYDCRVTSKNSIMSDQHERWENVFEQNTETSLLNKAQFNAILYGGCLSKNKLFNECADLAYKKSVEEGNENCLKQKRKCMESNLTGKNKAEELSRIRKEIKHHEWQRAINNRFLRQEKEEENPNADRVSLYKDEVQWAVFNLKELREELEIVSAWPD